MINRPASGQRSGELLVEFVRIGNYLKATAIDVATMTEVTALGPALGSQELLKRTVLKKLELALRRNFPRR